MVSVTTVMALLILGAGVSLRLAGSVDGCSGPEITGATMSAKDCTVGVLGAVGIQEGRNPWGSSSTNKMIGRTKHVMPH